MPKKQKKEEGPQFLDPYDAWLARQPVKHVKAKPGYVSSPED